MIGCTHRFTSAWIDDSGATAIEYALVGGVILGTVFAAAGAFGQIIEALYLAWAATVAAAL